MGIFTDEDINKIEEALILAGKDKTYRSEFLQVSTTIGGP